MESLTGANTVELAASSSSDLLQQIQDAQSRRVLWPWALAGVIVLAAAASDIGTWLSWLVFSLGLVGVAWTWQRDKARKTVVVFYDVNDEPAKRFDALVAAFNESSRSDRIWQMTASGAIHDTHTRKVSGGADHLVRRDAAKATTDGPPALSTNIAVPGIETDSRSVYLLPDRVLVLEDGTYADVPWTEITTESHMDRFIEEEAVPPDAEIVGRTWKYVNKNGGPDKRFNDNRELPICRYGTLTLTSPRGFRAEWQYSAPNSPELLTSPINEMRTAAPED